MKALTIRQPWASLIAAGVKTIETRSWSTRYRGLLLIHAGKHEPRRHVEEVEGWVYDQGLSDSGLGPGEIITASFDNQHRHPAPLGAVMAVAKLVDVLPTGCSGCRGLGWSEDENWSSPNWWRPGDGPRPQREPREGLVPCGFCSEGEWDHPWSSTDQIPLGDFTPGRYAWLLDNVRPLAAPVSAKGKQGLWTPGADLIEAVTDG